MGLGVRRSCARDNQTVQRTTGDDARVGVEFDDEYLAHVPSDPPCRRSCHDVPQEHRAVAARGCELRVVMRSRRVLARSKHSIDDIRVIHRDGKNFIAMSGVLLDFCAEVGVPKTHSAVLPAAEDVFGGSLGISGDMYCSFVIAKRRM